MRHRAVILALGLGVVSAGGIAALGWMGGFRLNATPSYPLGLWRIERPVGPIKVGDLVFICMPPGPGLTLGLERGYLRAGLCPGGAGPLIKTVAAVAGQAVEIDGQVLIDGKPLPSSLVLKADAEGRAMPIFAGGRVSEGTVFLHSDFVGSYDSRYFGPIPTSGALGLAREILTFTP